MFFSQHKEKSPSTHATVIDNLSGPTSILNKNTIFMLVFTMTTTNLSVVGSGPT
jgi:hypothetical protein